MFIQQFILIVMGKYKNDDQHSDQSLFPFSLQVIMLISGIALIPLCRVLNF
jgi:hypothetical protein